ncbi:hypothetical protein VP01_10717g1 [Puccinia sorghi]|uniref:Uncharacterized protein n=1 Tax=Puccinia sorghi TaxID=27349 RepID=A0A0L6VTP8_9BASI|nr:hypothetical protein VP01_10717g1 [Puccinia sorghi]
MDLSHLNLEEFSSSVKDTVQDSENHVLASVLNSDVVEIISKKVFDGQIQRLNAIFHDLQSLRTEEEQYLDVDDLISKVQSNILQTVDYMYKQAIISAKAFKQFYQMGYTFQRAALNMYITQLINDYHDLDTDFSDVNPTSTLNKWYSAHFRTLYEEI